MAFQCRQKSGGRFPYALEEFFLLARTFFVEPYERLGFQTLNMLQHKASEFIARLRQAATVHFFTFSRESS